MAKQLSESEIKNIKGTRETTIKEQEIVKK